MCKSDPNGRWMTIEASRNTAKFILETLVKLGGTVNYSMFYRQGDELLNKMETGTFWMFDVVVGMLESAGVVATETLPEQLGDDAYDYKITLVSEPTVPNFEAPDNCIWIERMKMPKGFRYVE
jgi:hypothetical protein